MSENIQSKTTEEYLKEEVTMNISLKDAMKVVNDQIERASELILITHQHQITDEVLYKKREEESLLTIGHTIYSLEDLIPGSFELLKRKMPELLPSLYRALEMHTKNNSNCGFCKQDME